MKRSRPKPVSDRRRGENAERARLLLQRFGPKDHWSCGYGAPAFCFGPVNGHEILKRSRGGSILDMDNVVLLCDYHNGWCEDHPLLAHEMGLARHAWERDED